MLINMKKKRIFLLFGFAFLMGKTVSAFADGVSVYNGSGGPPIGGRLYQSGDGRIYVQEDNGSTVPLGGGNSQGNYTQNVIAEAKEQQAEQAEYARDYRKLYADCLETYQLCKPPYEQISSCLLFESDPACGQLNIRQKVIADYIHNADTLHHRDCEFKLAACQGAGEEACRPYWTYCEDFDRQARQNKQRRGLPLPVIPKNISSLRPAQDNYTPCNISGDYALFNGEAVSVGRAEILENSTIELRSSPESKTWYPVGLIDANGHITPNKHLSHKDKSTLKKTAMLGRLEPNKYVMRCGVHNPPQRLAFYDQQNLTLSYDRLNASKSILLSVLTPR